MYSLLIITLYHSQEQVSSLGNRPKANALRCSTPFCGHRSSVIDHLPPSSVITSMVVSGPSPSGLNTCTVTLYCVYVCRFCISWLCGQKKKMQKMRKLMQVKFLRLFYNKMPMLRCVFSHSRQGKLARSLLCAVCRTLFFGGNCAVQTRKKRKKENAAVKNVFAVAEGRERGN